MVSKIQFQLLASSMSGKDGNIPYHFPQLAGMAASNCTLHTPHQGFRGQLPNWILWVGSRGAKILVAAGWSLYIALVVGILLVEERPQSKISSGTSGVSQLGRKDERAIGNQLAPAPLGSCAGYTPMASIGDRYGLMFVFSMQAPGAPTEPSKYAPRFFKHQGLLQTGICGVSWK